MPASRATSSVGSAHAYGVNSGASALICGTAAACAGMPSAAASASTVGRRRASPSSRQALDRHRLEERLEPEPADRARPAARRQDVVAAGRVVAGGDRRPRPDEDRAGVADAAGVRLGVAEQHEVLGRDRLGLLERRDARGRRRRGRARAARRARARSARASPSPSTTTSDGPPGRSIATSRETSSFASFTYGLPGPDDLVDALDVGEPADRLRARRAPRPRRCRAPRRPRRRARRPAAACRRRSADARGLRRHGAHDERRDEVARHVDADRVERHPAALERRRPARPRARCRPAAAPRASGERGRRARAAPRAAASPPATARAGSTPSSSTRPLAHRLVAPLLDLGDDRHRGHPLDGHDQDRRRAGRLELRQQPPDLGGRHERVHGDHARLGERQHARRAGGDELADRGQRRLGGVQHQVAVAARLDDRRAASPRRRRVRPRRRARPAPPRIREERRASAARSCAACCPTRRGRRSRRRARAAARSRPSR